MKRIATVLCLLGFTAACDGGGTDADPVQVVTATPSVLDLAIGDTSRISVTARTAGGANVDKSKVSFTSTAPAVASVDQGGLVRALAEGTAQVIASAGGLSDSVTVTVSSLLRFNVNARNACSSPDLRSGRIAATTQHAIIVADVNNPSGGFTDAEYAEIGREFDSEVWPVISQTFGAPSDIDRNAKVVIFYTRAVNELTPAGQEDSYIGGYFFARDLFPTTANQNFQACAGSNEAEMFYMLVPDPTGQVNGNDRTKEFVRRVTVGTLAHEFQHLINASRRLYVNSAVRQDGSWAETLWLDEGLSHIAEELTFYAASGLGPERNLTVDDLRSSQQVLDAFNAYQAANFGRLNDYLKAPSQHSPYDADDDLATRGAAWEFLRYAADRKTDPGAQAQVWFQLVNSKTFGFDNLEQVFGTDVLSWVRDWAVANHADDLLAPAAIYTHPSWNFRSIFPAFQSIAKYPLKVDTLSAGATVSKTLVAGGAAYVAFGVAGGARAELQITAGGTGGGTACVQNGPAVSLNVGQVYTTTWSNTPRLCVDAPAGGADYVLVPAHLTKTAGSLSVGVTGTNIAALGATSAPLASLNVLPRWGMVGLAAPLPDVGFERALRVRERVELGPRTGAGMPVFRASVAPTAPAAASDLVLALVRTR